MKKLMSKGVITGCIVILVCLVAGWISFRSISGYVAIRHQETCLDNLRRISVALHSYLADNDESWPTEKAWIAKRPLGESLRGCPSAPAIPHLDPPLPGGGIPGYAYNRQLGGEPSYTGNRLILQAIHTPQLTHPQLTFAVLDYTSGLPTTGYLNPYGANEKFPAMLEKGWKRHQNGGHYLFCDGHAQWLTEDKIYQSHTENCDNPGAKPTFCRD